MTADLAPVRVSSDVHVALHIAYVIAEAEDHLGLRQTQMSLDDRLHAILSEAAMRPADIKPDVYDLVYLISQQDRANVDHPEIKKQVGGPLHKPKPEPQKQ